MTQRNEPQRAIHGAQAHSLRIRASSGAWPVARTFERDHPVGTSVGVGAGALAGAAVGTAVGGPVGTMAGAAMGALLGGVAGHGVAELFDSGRVTATAEDADLAA